MHDIALMLVRFGKFLKTVILHFKYDHLVQNGRFSGKNNFKSAKFASSDLLIELLSILKIKFRLVISESFLAYFAFYHAMVTCFFAMH